MKDIVDSKPEEDSEYGSEYESEEDEGDEGDGIDPMRENWT